MAEEIKNVLHGLPWYMIVTLAICVGIFITGFLLPPMGKVDSSVLIGIGEIGGMTIVMFILVNWKYFSTNGASLRLRHKDSSVEINTKGTHSNGRFPEICSDPDEMGRGME